MKNAEQSRIERLLIVDDDRPTRHLLKAVLEREGFEVIEAGDGVTAVELFARERPALVLLDVVMPGMDGFAACARIRELDRDDGVAIIMLTGAEDLGAIRSAFDAGATDFITKPINWTLLTQRVYYSLRASALSREVRQNRLREASARHIARLVFWEWSLSDNRLHWSDDPGQLLGLDEHPIADAEAFMALVHHEDRGRARRAMRLMREGERHLEVELRLCLDEGVERLVRLVGERGARGADTNLVIGAFQDVTEMRRTESLVDYLALHDELTELGNRRFFLRQVRERLQALDGQAGALLVGWIDIARFHRYNEALGEEAGDWLLTRLAHRLTQQLGPLEAAARVGGDEFAVMLVDADLEEAHTRFERLLFSLRQPYFLGEQECVLTLSAGAACHPDHASDAKQLLALAQDAQQLARVQGRPLALATPQQNGARFSEALAMESALHLALDQQQFFLLYQPQLDLASGRLRGVEALLRWRHPQWGLVSPAHFVPILENLGLIGGVGHWVLVEACRQARRWADAGSALRVGINLSVRQFHEADLCGEIQRILTETGSDPRLIELEITESLAMQDPLHAIELLSCLREQGMKIAIDDFGIGHSSLEYLLRFPIDAIKIDRAFVNNVTTDRGSRAIVRAVAVMGESLGLDIIAEGVETLRQCDFVEALGVSEVQGYLIGKPMTADEIDALMHDFVRPGLGAPAPRTGAP